MNTIATPWEAIETTVGGVTTRAYAERAPFFCAWQLSAETDTAQNTERQRQRITIDTYVQNLPAFIRTAPQARLNINGVNYLVDGGSFQEFADRCTVSAVQE